MSLKARVVLCVLAGSIAGLVFYRVRGLFPEHAFLLGLAIGALTYSLLRAFDNLRSGPGHGAPWDQQNSADE